MGLMFNVSHHHHHIQPDIPEIHRTIKSCHFVMQISPENHNTNGCKKKTMLHNFNIKIDQISFNISVDDY